MSTAERISHYRIIRKLGAGGMGEVYLAEDEKLERKVAIKLISAASVVEEKAKRRLLREARAAAALDHPNICTVHEVGEEDGRHFIVMQFVDGQTLSAALPARTLGIDESLEIAAQIAGALAEAHSRGITHRDIKPDNIMLNASGQVKVLDFGLAKRATASPLIERDAETQSLLTERGAIVGTVRYMSPEQVRAEELDARADVFSFGVVLYEMLGGRHPFARPSMGETISAILTEEPPRLSFYRPDVPAELERIVRKCLEKDRAGRYPTGRELSAELRELKTALASGATSREVEAVGAAAPKKKSPRLLRPALIAVFGVAAAALMVGVVLFASAMLSRRGEAVPGFLSPRGESKGAGGAQTEEIDSIAVLPFVNASRDDEMDYLGDGLTDSLIGNLAQLPVLRVIARNSVFRYKGRDIDPVTVGRELNVQTILLGTIDERQDTLTISVELIDARDQKRLWFEKYNPPKANILNVQEDISRGIAESLRLRLSGRASDLLARKYTQSPEAQLLYLKGRYFWNKRTDESLKKGIELFNQAIDLDPGYALAYAGLADSYTLLGSSGYERITPKESMQRAEAAALRALEIDDTLGEAHASLAIIKLQYAWDWPGCEREFKEAISLKPSYATAHYWYSIYLLTTGRRDESIAESRRARELDPLSPIVGVNVARTLYFARRPDEAITECRKTLELDPDFVWVHFILGISYEQKGMFDEAIAAFKKCLSISPDNPSLTAALGHAYAISGRRGEALAVIDRLKEQSAHQTVAPMEFATIYAGLGERDAAFRWLEKACEERSSALIGINVEPAFENLRPDPRFQSILACVGFARPA